MWIDDYHHIQKTNAFRLSVWSHSTSSGKVGLVWIKTGTTKDYGIRNKWLFHCVFLVLIMITICHRFLYVDEILFADLTEHVLPDTRQEPLAAILVLIRNGLHTRWLFITFNPNRWYSVKVTITGYRYRKSTKINTKINSYIKWTGLVCHVSCSDTHKKKLSYIYIYNLCLICILIIIKNV